MSSRPKPRWANKHIVHLIARLFEPVSAYIGPPDLGFTFQPHPPSPGPSSFDPRYLDPSSTARLLLVDQLLLRNHSHAPVNRSELAVLEPDLSSLLVSLAIDDCGPVLAPDRP